MLQLFILIGGVFCCASSALLIKASSLHPAVLSTHRLLLAAIVLFPLYCHLARKHHHRFSLHHLKLVLAPGLVLALHFISWAQGAQWTHAANASLIVNMVPVAMPILLYFVAGELIGSKELLGTVVCLTGAALLAASDFWISRQSLAGDLVCFCSMLLFTYYLVQGRVSRQFPSLWLYLVPLYALAGTGCLLLSLVLAGPPSRPSPGDAWISLALAVVPTIIGHSILNHAMKNMRGQVVSTVNLLQFLFTALLGYVLFREIPSALFYLSLVLVVGGAVLVIFSASSAPRLNVSAKARC